MLKRMTHKAKALLFGARGAQGTRGTRGESLVEVLTAIVIGGLALLMLGMAISAASRMAINSRETMEDYYQAGNDIASGKADSLGEGTVSLAGDAGSPVALIASSESLKVRYIESDVLGSSSIVLYEVGAGSSTGGGA